MKRHFFHVVVASAIGSAVCLQLCAQTAKAGIDNDAAAASATVKVQRPLNEYLIGPDDILAINVWKEPEISRTLPVRPDGNISLPLVGDLRASGRTPMQLQKEIKDQLARKRGCNSR